MKLIRFIGNCLKRKNLIFKPKIKESKNLFCNFDVSGVRELQTEPLEGTFVENEVISIENEGTFVENEVNFY